MKLELEVPKNTEWQEQMSPPPKKKKLQMLMSWTELNHLGGRLGPTPILGGGRQRTKYLEWGNGELCITSLVNWIELTWCQSRIEFNWLSNFAYHWCEMCRDDDRNRLQVIRYYGSCSHLVHLTFTSQCHIYKAWEFCVERKWENWLNGWMDGPYCHPLECVYRQVDSFVVWSD